MLKVFSFKPADIVKQLNLLRPIYSKTTNYGHIGKIDDPDITWELTNKAEALKKAQKKITFTELRFYQWRTPFFSMHRGM